ncbi:2-succinylbenzoate--CoA ligase, chloroplastic/peroxisomal [Impatiens glandulifera]|uniref:2-succinylbenzoate--CoA ligase, chloroplastic/peroxisomal n=1 Tax=Impatiens glandulifera TaxID=253017 RepID=UPI001FB11EBD|nr:2-succinylbenzoate--CoA ligase, chloroplastic/peroxisomal [Impatiens glandulifera]
MSNYSGAHICQCLSRIATSRRTTTVTISGDRHKTGKEFVDRVLGLAGGLTDLGLLPGDVVALSALNSDLYLEWLLAITFVGGIVAPLNYRWSLEEAKSAMETVRPVMLVVDESSSHFSSSFHNDILPSLRWHVFININYPTTDLINMINVVNSKSCMSSLLIIVFKSKSIINCSQILINHFRFSLMSHQQQPQKNSICYLAGTTGRPKGVAISHSALVMQSMAKLACVGYSEDDVYLHTAPLCHIGGISSGLAMLMVGGRHILFPKFEASSTLKAIRQFRVTSFLTVPAIMSDIVSLTRRDKTLLNGMETVTKILNGGGGLSNDLIKEAINIFPRAKIFSAYGMTETCSSMTFMTLHDPTSTPPPHSSLGATAGGVCVGKAAPHVEIRIGSEGHDTSSGGVGKILTRGPHVMLGYWGQTITNELNSNKDVWLDTGDIGMVDGSGQIWLVGRNKGRIKSGGENVFPEEVEGIISQHPGVDTCVVMGVPDQRFTEMVVACIKPKDKWKWVIGQSNDENTLSANMIQQFCKQKNLTGFKIPRRFIVWTKPFPLTTTGKLKRDIIKEEVVSGMQYISSNL